MAETVKLANETGKQVVSEQGARRDTSVLIALKEGLTRSNSVFDQGIPLLQNLHIRFNI